MRLSRKDLENLGLNPNLFSMSIYYKQDDVDGVFISFNNDNFTGVYDGWVSLVIPYYFSADDLDYFNLRDNIIGDDKASVLDGVIGINLNVDLVVLGHVVVLPDEGEFDFYLHDLTDFDVRDMSFLMESEQIPDPDLRTEFLQGIKKYISQFDLTKLEEDIKVRLVS